MDAAPLAFFITSTQQHWIAIAIFVATYVLIAVESGRGSHLDRTAAAFCGAVAMVLTGVVRLEEAYRTINWDTIIFLLGIMILVAHFQISGFFDWIATSITRLARTRLQLLIAVVLTAGILSAFFVNDTICLIFTPIILAVTDRLSLPPLPYLVAVATASNVGSVMSITGNPQNALVGVTAHFSFLGFLGHLAPVSVIGLGITCGLLALVFRREILGHALEMQAPVLAVRPHRKLLLKCGISALLVVALWIMGYSFPLVAISIGAFILVIGRVKVHNVYQRVDWELLLFFASLFVVMRGFEASGATAALMARFRPALQGGTSSQLFAVSVVMLILANLVSNVPAVLLVRPFFSSLANSHFLWLAVASTSTLAGNATPLSSVANLIVLQQAGKRVRITFWQFARAGLILTVLTSLAAIGILALEQRWFPS